MVALPDDLFPILRHWASILGTDPQIRRLSEKHTVLAVQSPGGEQYILKAADGTAFAEHIAGRLDLLNYLHTQRVPVAAPVPIDGAPREFLVEVGGQRYWLAPYLASGYAAETPDWYANTGAAIAHLHRALAAYPETIHSWRMDLVRDTLKVDAPLLRERLAETGAVAFNRAVNYLAQRLPGRLPGLPAQHIHGDCHGGNILWEGEHVSGFVDLDHLPWGPRVYDLGYFLADTAKNRFCRPGDISGWFAGLRPFLQGYQSGLALSGAEITILPAVMMAVQVRFAAWFARHEDPERVQFNLEALYWLDEQSGRILREMEEAEDAEKGRLGESVTLQVSKPPS